MKVFWLNDSVTIQAEVREEREALAVLLDAFQREKSTDRPMARSSDLPIASEAPNG
jgi:hypothetical protein